MPKKLSYPYIKSAFEKEGCSLLTEVYINNITKLDYICPNGHKHSITWSDFNSGYRCSLCANNIKLTYNFVKEAFEKEGYVLLSKTYINNKQKLEYTCPEGHLHSIIWNSFDQGHRCPSCAGLSKPTYEFVKKYFEKEGYTLSSTKYSNNRTKLKFVCPNGHSNSIRWGDFFRGRRCCICSREATKGSGNNNWKGGVKDKALPLYDTYAPQLKKYQSVYKIVQDDLELLGVECIYCNQVFVPTIKSVVNKINAANSTTKGEANLYCSNNCKKACPTYGQQKYPKGEKPYEDTRSDQKQWANMVKTRDKYTCQNCGTTEGKMIAHHILPVALYPIESADVDNGKTLCEACDKLVHQTPGCSYNELKCAS